MARYELSQITPPPGQVPTDPSVETAEGIASFNKDSAEMQRNLHDLRMKALNQDMGQRKEYANRIFQLLQFCLLFTGCMILLKAIHKIELSDNVLIVMMTTASANVIAIFIYVVKYLFNTTAEKWKLDY